MYHNPNRHHFRGFPYLPMQGMNLPPGAPMFARGHFDAEGQRNQEESQAPPTDSHEDPGTNYWPHRHGFHMFGRHFKRLRFLSSSSSSSDSSSDSDNKSKKKLKKNKKNKKFNKKRGKYMKKHWKRIHHLMSEPNWNKVQCTLCWRPIRPFVETEVLECGHIYHRMCLKELFTVSQTEDKSEIFCTQCRQQIDSDSITKFQNRFNAKELTPAPQSPQNQDMDN